MAARIGVGDKGKESSQAGVKERSNGEKISIFYEGDTTHQCQNALRFIGQE